MGTDLGRFRQIDGRHTRDDASKTLIATFTGRHFVSERSGEDLLVFSIGDENGLPGVSTINGGTGDAQAANASGLRALNRSNAERRAAELARRARELR